MLNAKNINFRRKTYDQAYRRLMVRSQSVEDTQRLGIIFAHALNACRELSIQTEAPMRIGLSGPSTGGKSTLCSAAIAQSLDVEISDKNKFRADFYKSYKKGITMHYDGIIWCALNKPADKSVNQLPCVELIEHPVEDHLNPYFDMFVMIDTCCKNPRYFDFYTTDALAGTAGFQAFVQQAKAIFPQTSR